jgi:polyhydroxybutyrate depolymerase
LIAFSLIRSRLVSFVCVYLSICVASCGGSAATPKAIPSSSAIRHASLTIDGQKRTYRLYVPPSLDPKQAAPIVVALTGFPGTGDEIAKISHLDDQATTLGFIVVYPDPLPDSQADPSNPLEGSWNAGTCCGDASAKGVDDVTFINRLLDRLTTDFLIDTKRIFVAGLSNGGMMAYRLACQLSDRVAAVASVAGALVIDDCHPTRSVSILEMHGTDDSIVPYAGNPTYNVPPTASVIQRWVALDGCTGKPTQTASGITKTSIWIHCRTGTVIRFDTVTGGHHTWFGSDLDPVPGEPNATSVVWDFFKNLAPRA